MNNPPRIGSSGVSDRHLPTRQERTFRGLSKLHASLVRRDEIAKACRTKITMRRNHQCSKHNREHTGNIHWGCTCPFNDWRRVHPPPLGNSLQKACSLIGSNSFFIDMQSCVKFVSAGSKLHCLTSDRNLIHGNKRKLVKNSFQPAYSVPVWIV